MKKFVILLIVLGLVNVASAGIVDIQISSLNGVPIAPVKEITIDFSDIINFDITYEAAAGWILYSLSTEVVMVGPGELDPSEPTEPDGAWKAELSPGASLLANGNILLDYSADQGVPGQGLGIEVIAIDHLLMHCLDLGDVILTLVENPNTSAGFTTETDGSGLFFPEYGPGVTIHQIPEPMTLTLLGLGGLLLRRRKK